MRPATRLLIAHQRASVIGVLLIALTTLAFVPGSQQPVHGQMGCMSYMPYMSSMPYMSCPVPSVGSTYVMPSSATNTVAPASVVSSSALVPSPSTATCGSSSVTVSSADLDAGDSLTVGCYQSGTTTVAVFGASNGAGAAGQQVNACLDGATCQTVQLGSDGSATATWPPSSSPA